VGGATTLPVLSSRGILDSHENGWDEYPHRSLNLSKRHNPVESTDNLGVGLI
jgi:hypothetical protein